MYEHTAVDWVLEEEQELYYVTEQVQYSYAFGQWRNSVVFEVSSTVLRVLNEGHDRLPNSISPLAEMTFAADVVLRGNFLPSE